MLQYQPPGLSGLKEQRNVPFLLVLHVYSTLVQGLQSLPAHARTRLAVVHLFGMLQVVLSGEEGTGTANTGN